MKDASFSGCRKRPAPQGFERGQHDLLCKVGRRLVIPQVPQAVQANTRHESPAQLGLGIASLPGWRRRDLAHQVRILRLDHRAGFPEFHVE